MGQDDISTMYPVTMLPPSKVDPYQASVSRSASLGEKIKHYQSGFIVTVAYRASGAERGVCDAGYLSMLVM